MSAFNDTDTNPFEDPAVRNVTQQSNPNQSTLEGYNPFEKGQQSQSPNPTLSTVPPDVTLQTKPMSQSYGESNAPPPYTSTAAQDAAALDLQRRQEELERKAKELQAREESLQSSIAAGQIYTFLLFLNMIGALALFIANGDGTTFGISLLISFLFTPLSFVCWFRPLYKAFRSDSSFNFMVFFFIFFFQFVVAVVYAVGIPHMGSCGLLNGITTLTSGGSHSVSTYTVGVMAILIGFLWAIDAMASFYMLVKIHRIYRTTGASLAKAQEEFASGVMRNPHVQSAATTVVTNAAQEALNRQMSGVRY